MNKYQNKKDLKKVILKLKLKLDSSDEDSPSEDPLECSAKESKGQGHDNMKFLSTNKVSISSVTIIVIGN